MYKKLYYIICLAVLTSACGVSKNSDKKQPLFPVVFRNAPEVDAGSIAGIPWRLFFQDSVLQQLIDSSLIRNYNMQIALKNSEQARLVLTQSKWSNAPLISLNVSVNSSNPSGNSLNGFTLGQSLGTNHLEDYSTNFTISWEADIWGKIRNTNKVVLAKYLQTAEARKLIQTNLVASVSQNYFNLLMLDAQLNVAHRNLALTDSTRKIVQLQFDAGHVTSLAVQQAQAQHQLAAKLVPGLEQDIIVQENAIQILVGHFPSTIKRNAMFNEISFPTDISAGIPAELVSRRPDVKSRELDLAIANAKVGISKANMYPALRITSSAGVSSLRTSDWFTLPTSMFGLIMASVSQPLLNRKELKTQFQLARIEREKAVLLFRQTVLRAVGEVSDALARIEKLKSSGAIAEQRVKTLREATANANLLFKSGMANYLEVIIAQGNALQSELEHTALKRSELRAVSDLYRSLGGGVN